MYEKMYHIMAAAAADAIDLIKTQEYQAALIRLEQAGREAEEVYISA